MKAILTSAFAILTLITPVNAAALAHSSVPEQTKYVNVAVGTLWVDPTHPRPVDTPALSNPVDIPHWLTNITNDERYWLVGEVETQALYGQKVIVTDTQSDWVHVVVPGQPTPRDPRGYPGWIPKAQLADSPLLAHTSHLPFAQVHAITAGLYTNPALTQKTMDLSFNTRLPVLSRTKTAVLVATPGNNARWLPSADVNIYRNEAEILSPTKAELIATAKRFIGTVYLWGGTSSFAFDCSGFTYTMYHHHGVTIPRDAQDQAIVGTPVAYGQWQPGDLIFYAHDRGTGNVHHVGMYVGNGYEIDAPTDTATMSGGVELVKVNEHRYADEYAGSRRFLQ